MRAQVLPRLNAVERDLMEQLLSSQSLDHRQGTRLQVVLGRADGKTTSEIARALQIHPMSVSEDPEFDRKLEDSVGLYLDPPENATPMTMSATESPTCTRR
jgi:DNA-binding CsgD family transcriptional regulator